MLGDNVSELTVILPNKIKLPFKTISALVAGIFLFSVFPSYAVFVFAAQPPLIDSAVVQKVAQGYVVNITGSNLGSAQGSSQISLNGTISAIVKTWADTSITCVIPDCDVNEDGVTDTGDEAVVFGNLTGFSRAAESNRYDLNRDGKVNATDVLIVRHNSGIILPNNGTLKVITDSGESNNVAVSLSSSPPIQQTADALLDETEALACDYFYGQILTYDVSYGLVKDVTCGNYASIAATGFGLSALCVMASRYNTTPNWHLTPAAAAKRVSATLDTLISIQNKQSTNENLYGKKCFFYHFIDWYGKREMSVNSEVSTVDMAILLSGVLTAGQYFGGDIQVKAIAIFNAVDWTYFLNPANKQFYHGWSPEAGMIQQTWDRPGDETLLVSLLAIASNPLNAQFQESYYAFPRVKNSYISPGGETFDLYNSYSGSLVTYILAHCWFDFEKLGEDMPSNVPGARYPIPVNWWDNSMAAARANRQFCIDNAGQYSSYGPNSWGLSACFRPDKTYFGMNGALPREYVPPSGGEPAYDGTVPPHGAISALPFMKGDETPEGLSSNPSYKALEHYYKDYFTTIWGAYGPYDSFNNLGQFSNLSVGIDLGPMALMIENYRSGLLWNVFMQDARIEKAKHALFTDTAPPVITGFTVNNPDSPIPGYTASPTVNVTMADYDAAGTVAKWLITETQTQPIAADFNTSGSSARPIAYTITTGGDGLKALYAWAMDNSNNVSVLTANSQAHIYLDTTPPSMGPVVTDGPNSNSVSQLHARWSAQDAESGIAEYQYRISDSTAGGLMIRDWTSTGAATEGTAAGLSLIKNHSYYFSVKARNGAGLWSNISSSAGVTLVQSAPSIISITPSDGSVFEIGATMPFNINASDPEGDAIQYKIVVGGQIISDWSSSANFNWTVASGTPGIQQAVIYAKDAWGNEASGNMEVYLARKALDTPQLQY